MKRIVLILFLIVFVSSFVYSSYAPWASISFGSDMVFTSDSLWPSFMVGGEISLLSFSLGDWIISLPLGLYTVTPSVDRNGERTLEKGKMKMGVGGEYRKKPYFVSLYFYTGVTEYMDLEAFERENTLSLSPGLTINDHLAFIFPLEYNFSSFNPSLTLKAGIKMGGRI